MAHRIDRDGNPNVFNVERNDDGLWLNDNIANPDNDWNDDNKFMFRLRKWFFPRSQGAVFLLWIIKVFPPPAEHLTDLF